jgi:uncharacterized protein (DUF1697 family)
MPSHVALLRAVNVGGRSLAMADLREVAEGLGYDGVKTLLQSGNLVFDAKGRADALEKALQTALKKQVGLEADVLIRSAKALDAVIAANPFPGEAKSDPSHLVVMFLKDRATPKAVDAVRAGVKGREVVRYNGRELYITYPDGIGRSKLTGAVIEKALGTRGTARNWNTVTKLAALLCA